MNKRTDRKAPKRFLPSLDRRKAGIFLFFIFSFALSVMEVGVLSDVRAEETDQTETNGGDHVAVVTSPTFIPALNRWITYRQSQGYRIHLILTRDEEISENGVTAAPWPMSSPTMTGPVSPESIRRQIRTLASQVRLTAILLVGDGASLAGQSNFPDDPLGSASDILPAPRVTTDVIDQFGPEDHIASDAWFADLDDDDFPDLAVGRLPVRTPRQLSDVIDKILYYETVALPGEWQRKISFIAGLAGFSPVLDNVINSAVRQTLGATIPDDFDFLLAQANWKSPYCPDPTLFRFTAIDQINQGPLFWVYMGHGLNRELDRLVTPRGSYKILEMDDVRHVDCSGSLPILIFCACYTGAYDSTESSLAEEFFLTPRGPVAVIASSRTSMPYGMAVFGVEMMEETFTRNDSLDRLTLGEMILAAKRRMKVLAPVAKASSPKPDGNSEADGGPEWGDPSKPTDGPDAVSLDDRSKTRRSLDELARIFDPTSAELGGQLRDHRHLFNLFGDPLLRVRFPRPIPIDVPEIGYASETVTVSSLPLRPDASDPTEAKQDEAALEKWSPTETEGDISKERAEADVLVELVCLPTRPKIRSVDRKEFSLTDEDRITYQRTFEKANDRVLSAVRGKTTHGKFRLDLPIPAETSGSFIVRVLVTDHRQTEVGACRIRIRKRSAPPRMK